MSALPPGGVTALLQRATAGDHSAVHALIERNLPLLRARVRRRLGPALRRDMDSADVMHDVVVSLLAACTPGVIRDEEHFRALLVRVVDTDVRDRLRYQRRERRDRRRERPMPADGGSATGAPVESVTRPSQHVDRNERIAWIRAAMLRLAPEDQHVLQRRVFDGQPFATLAAELDVAEDTARMRVNRALARLARAVAALRGIDVTRQGASGPTDQ